MVRRADAACPGSLPSASLLLGRKEVAEQPGEEVEKAACVQVMDGVGIPGSRRTHGQRVIARRMLVGSSRRHNAVSIGDYARPHTVGPRRGVTAGRAQAG